MTVTAETTIYELVDAYPYLLDWLVDYDSHFSALKNPALFKTMARVAKIETAASMAGVDADKMLDDIRTEIATHEIAAEENSNAPATPVDPEVLAARQAALKSIIRKLHDGVPVETVKAEFDALIVDVDSAEIARMEQSLIAEGMPVEDVQRLCDVHVTVFKEALDDKPSAAVDAGHPIDSYKRENEIATRLIADLNLVAERACGRDRRVGPRRGTRGPVRQARRARRDRHALHTQGEPALPGARDPRGRGPHQGHVGARRRHPWPHQDRALASGGRATSPHSRRRCPRPSR